MASNILYAVIICFLLVKITKWWDDRKDRSNLMVASEQTQTEITVKKDTNMEKTIRTRDLFIEVLTKIGCQYQSGEGDDTRIIFAFQGENMWSYMTLMRWPECVKPLIILTLIPQLLRYTLSIKKVAAWMCTAVLCLRSCLRCRLLRTI